MKSTFSVYDPMVLQALRAQGSQYEPPQPPLMAPDPQTLEQLYADMNAPPPEPAPVESLPMGQQIGMMNASGPTMPTAFAGSPEPFMAPRLAAPPLARVQASQEQPQQPELPPPQQPQQARSRSAGGARPSQSAQRRDAALEGMLDTFDARQAASEALTGVRSDTARARSDLADRSAVDDMMAQQELADAAEAHQAATAKVQQEQRDDAEFIRSYVPSDRRTTKQRTMGAIAVALAGFGDSFSAAGGGQANAVDRTLGVINGAIDRDIDLQQRMLDNKRTALAAKNTELGQMRERYGETVDSIKLARVMKIEQYQKELDAVVAEGIAQEGVAVTKDTQAQLEMQKQQILYDVYGSRFKQEMAARQGMSAEKRLSLEGKALDNEKKRQDLSGGGPGGAALPGYEPTQALQSGDLSTARKIHASAESLKADYARLEAIRRRGGGTVLNRNDIVEAEAIINGMAPKYSQLYGAGAPSETELKMFGKTLVNPTDYQVTGLLDPIESYKRGMSQIDAITKAQLGSYGYKPTAASDARSRVRPGAAR